MKSGCLVQSAQNSAAWQGTKPVIAPLAGKMKAFYNKHENVYMHTALKKGRKGTFPHDHQ